MKIKVHVEELVLEGLPAAHRHRIGAAVRMELARLLAERGLPPELPSGGRLPQPDGGSLGKTQGIHPEALGQQVHEAVYKGLHR
jgi:hypothetical protein